MMSELSCNPTKKASVHGGHTIHCDGFNTPQEMADEYERQNFEFAVLTMHAIYEDSNIVYPSKKFGKELMSQQQAIDEMAVFFEEVREVQKQPRNCKVYATFESDTFPVFQSHTEDLIKELKPDFVLGSSHVVFDQLDESKYFTIDNVPEIGWKNLLEHFGSHIKVYERYFDQQYDVINLDTSVIAHFDRISQFDPDYIENFKAKSVEDRIDRNLEMIAKKGQIIDFNLAWVSRGGPRAAPSDYILKRIKELGIKCVPGDDAHRVRYVGSCIDWATEHLSEFGFDTNWEMPKLINEDPFENG